MMNDIIKSNNNKIFKFIKSLSVKKYRLKYNSFLVEGFKLVEEALKEGIVEQIIINEKLDYDRILNLSTDRDIIVLSDSLFSEISSMKNSENIIAVCCIKERELEFSDEKILCLDGLKDPGNMGAIIRSAEAFGFKTIILMNDCVDIYNPKVIRASMGSLFRTDFIEIDCISTLNDLKSSGYKIIATGLEGKNIRELKDMEKFILIIGSESHGISSEVKDISDIITAIPMYGELDSLNAAIAASIYMYEFSF